MRKEDATMTHTTMTFDQIRCLWPAHPVKSTSFVAALVESMRQNGWIGQPLVVHTPSGSLFSAVHRRAAILEIAKSGDFGALDVHEIPVFLVDQVDAEPFSSDTEEDLAQKLREVGADEAADILEAH
jgi:hypothetical protein